MHVYLRVFSQPALRNSVHMSRSMMIPAPFPGSPAQASEPEPGLWFSAHRRSFPLHGHEPTYSILPDNL